MSYEFHPARIEGIFDNFPSDMQETIKEVVSRYHVRNGHKNNDGSLGTIRMSPKQLRDLLAFIMMSIGAAADADEQDVGID